jgi:bifunctional UDP-N-acetylglucosamine pyrophosphorylase / glucosamine-1-phosphate N-acetyltransferase
MAEFFQITMATFAGIVEQKDASPEQLTIKEINAGIYCVDSNFLFSALRQVGTDNSQNEVYLTDIVSQAVHASARVGKFMVASAARFSVSTLGSNWPKHTDICSCKRNRQLMLDGVTILDPQTVTVSPQTQIAKDTILESFVRISGKSHIGPRVVTVGKDHPHPLHRWEGAVLGPYCCLNDTDVPADTNLAPFSKNS